MERLTPRPPARIIPFPTKAVTTVSVHTPPRRGLSTTIVLPIHHLLVALTKKDQP